MADIDKPHPRELPSGYRPSEVYSDELNFATVANAELRGNGWWYMESWAGQRIYVNGDLIEQVRRLPTEKTDEKRNRGLREVQNLEAVWGDLPYETRDALHWSPSMEES